VNNSKGVIVHSSDSKCYIKRKFPAALSRRVRFPAAGLGLNQGKETRLNARRTLEIPDSELCISAFGFITPPKQINLILQAFSHIKTGLPPFKIYLVGEALNSESLDNQIRDFCLQEHVVKTGFVDLETFENYIAATDIVLSLRYPSAGETSAALIRAMEYGACNICFDYASYVDFPSDTVAKLPLDTNDSTTLSKLILRLANKPAYRTSLGENAKRYLAEKHSAEDVAIEMSEFIEMAYQF